MIKYSSVIFGMLVLSSSYIYNITDKTINFYLLLGGMTIGCFVGIAIYIIGAIYGSKVYHKYFPITK
jgi:membrane protein DedA with SNARE-associated domain